MPIENVVVLAVLLALLSVAIFLLLRRPRHRKPDGVIHIIRREPDGRWADYQTAFYDNPPKKRRSPPTP